MRRNETVKPFAYDFKFRDHNNGTLLVFNVTIARRLIFTTYGTALSVIELSKSLKITRIN